MPQTGSDLVSAGYPISSPLQALLGGTTLSAQPNSPVKTNLSFAMGNLTDVTVGSVAAGAGSVLSVAVPVTPGDVITKISFLVGGLGTTPSASVTNLWAALYTGTGSAPGTVGAAPSLIASGLAGSAAGSVAIASVARLDFTLTSPQTITAVQAPYGYVYASYSLTTPAGSPSSLSLISVTAAASTGSQVYYANAPVGLYMSSNAAAGSAIPATLGTATRLANPPVVLLT